MLGREKKVWLLARGRRCRLMAKVLVPIKLVPCLGGGLAGGSSKGRKAITVLQLSSLMQSFLAIQRLSCLSVGWSAINFSSREVTLPCSHRSTCFITDAWVSNQLSSPVSLWLSEMPPSFGFQALLCLTPDNDCVESVRLSVWFNFLKGREVKLLILSEKFFLCFVLNRLTA